MKKYGKDDMEIFADFLGEMIAKYIDRMDLDNLPDPEKKWVRRYVSGSYKNYMKYKNRYSKR